MENFLWNEPPLPVGRYLDPLSTYGFEKLLGSRPQRKCLIHLLNAVFEGKKEVADLVYLAGKKDRSVFAPPGAIVDLLCTEACGNKFFCELQCPLPPAYPGLAQWYSMDLFLDHGFKRVRHYRPSEVFVISVYAFQLPDIKPCQYICHFNLGGEDGCPEGPQFIFVEPAQFNLKISQITSDLHRWIYLFKHLADMSEIPATMRREVFTDLIAAADTNTLSPAAVLDYTRCLKEKETYCDIWNKKLYRSREAYEQFAPKRTPKKNQVKLHAKL